jgi:hypothetical protein
MSEQEAIDISKIKPIGRHILVRKCIKADEGLIITPEQYKHDTNFVEILTLGNKCRVFTPETIGKCVQCPDNADGMFCVNPDDGADYWMVKEELLDPCLFE